MNEDYLISRIDAILQAETGSERLPDYVRTELYAVIMQCRAETERAIIELANEKLKEALL
ncbi:MAG TPA: hypothetical protein P5522_08605 [Spirochaetia bacterium]|nr:hypothetical protein [Spirochaetia bacterium]